MTTTRTTLALTLTALLVIVTGCDTTRPPSGAKYDPVRIEEYPQVELDTRLHDALVMDRPVVDPATHDRPMKVNVPIRSFVDKPLNIQYQFTFFDEAGRPMRDGGRGWRFIHVAPRSQVFMKANSLETFTEQAATRGENPSSWRLIIRPAT